MSRRAEKHPEKGTGPGGVGGLVSGRSSRVVFGGFEGFTVFFFRHECLRIFVACDCIDNERGSRSSRVQPCAFFTVFFISLISRVAASFRVKSLMCRPV